MLLSRHPSWIRKGHGVLDIGSKFHAQRHARQEGYCGASQTVCGGDEGRTGAETARTPPHAERPGPEYQREIQLRHDERQGTGEQYEQREGRKAAGAAAISRPDLFRPRPSNHVTHYGKTRESPCIASGDY